MPYYAENEQLFELATQPKAAYPVLMVMAIAGELLRARQQLAEMDHEASDDTGNQIAIITRSERTAAAYAEGSFSTWTAGVGSYQLTPGRYPGRLLESSTVERVTEDNTAVCP